MQQSTLVTRADNALSLYLRSFWLIRPVILAGVATALLFTSVDRNDPWSTLTAVLGIAMLGTVMCRQLGEIIQLEQQVLAQNRQLSVVSEVVSTLNASPNVGSNLGAALDRLMTALSADAGAIWLPSPASFSKLQVVEQRALVEVDLNDELLPKVQAALRNNEQPVATFHTTLSHSRQPLHFSCVRMGRDGVEFGYVLLAKEQAPFSPTDLQVLEAIGSDIGGALHSIRLIGEARKLADRDPVTALHNHRSIYQRLHQETERHQRIGKSMAVIMMDLDNFKLFNDTYGHPAGDEVLKRVAGVLRRSCREADSLARYGGDEFLLVLPETTLPNAIRCAERIQANLARERFRCQDSAPLPIGLSYGVAVYPDDGADVKELVAAADANLYRSKTHGGNQITSRRSSTTLSSAQVHEKGFDLFSALVAAIDNKDGYTRQHSEEVTEYSLQIARAMGLSEDMLHTIHVSGILHDVGKIGVPDAILRKPGRLTDEEFQVMRQHPVFGALIVGALPGMDDVVLGVRHHHERYDGRGYPDGLAGEEIPLIGRIMAVADAFSAMTTSRPYRKGMNALQALREIRANLGTQFDPEIGELFVTLQLQQLQSQPEPVLEATRPMKPERTTRRKRKPTPVATPATEPPATPA